jgi:hypothetical protein
MSALGYTLQIPTPIARKMARLKAQGSSSNIAVDPSDDSHIKAFRRGVTFVLANVCHGLRGRQRDDMEEISRWIEASVHREFT